MDLDQTQAIVLEDFADETDEEEAGQDKQPVAYLKVLCQKGFPETKFPLYEGDNVIGRQQDICNIYIPIKALSKQHACIEIRGESHLIYDKGSRNKTKRGKLYLSPEVRYELRPGDEICLADVSCVYLLSTQSDVTLDDSGSETGSESMFQTARANTVSVPDTQDNTSSRILVEATPTEEQDDDEISNASSDLLQPTQLFGADLGDRARKGRLNEATTLMFAEDSDHSDNETNYTHFRKRKSVTVAETPAVTRTAPSAGPASTLVLTESDCEDERGTEAQTLVFEDDKEELEGRENILAAPTQAYVMDSDPEDDEKDRSDSLLGAATQMFDGNQTNQGETTSDALTLAYDATFEEEVESQTLLSAATQAYGPTDPTQNDPTLAYDIMTEMKEGDKRKPPDKTGPGEDMLPTQVYDMGTDTTNDTDDQADTETFEVAPETEKTENSAPEGESESSTQAMGEGNSDSNIAEGEMVDFFAAPTMACDLEPDEAEIVEPSEDADGKVNKEATGNLEDNPTQLFDTVSMDNSPGKSPRSKTTGRVSDTGDICDTVPIDNSPAKSPRSSRSPKKAALNDTVEMSDTVPVENSPEKSPTSPRKRARNKRPSGGECDVSDTLLVENSTVKSTRSPQKAKGSNSSIADTVEIPDTMPIQQSPGKSSKSPGADRVDDESNIDKDPSNRTPKGKVESTVATLIFDAEDDESGPEVAKYGDVSCDDPTQVFGSDERIPDEDLTVAETQMISDADSSPQKHLQLGNKDSTENTSMGFITGPTLVISEGDFVTSTQIGSTETKKSEEKTTEVKKSGQTRRSTRKIQEIAAEATQACESDSPVKNKKGNTRRSTKQRIAVEMEATQAYGSDDHDQTDSSDTNAKHNNRTMEATQLYGSGDQSDKEKGKSRRSLRHKQEVELEETQAEQTVTRKGKSRRSKLQKKEIEMEESSDQDDMKESSDQDDMKTEGRRKFLELETQAFSSDEQPEVEKCKSRRNTRQILEEATQAFGNDEQEVGDEDTINKQEVEVDATQPYGSDDFAEVLPGKSRGTKQIQEIELEATQAYGSGTDENNAVTDDDTVEPSESLSILMEKNEMASKNKSVVSSEEVVPDSCELTETAPTAIPLPAHSPHKSSLSPGKRTSVSPKRVVFTGLVDDSRDSAATAEIEQTVTVTKSPSRTTGKEVVPGGTKGKGKGKGRRSIKGATKESVSEQTSARETTESESPVIPICDSNIEPGVSTDLLDAAEETPIPRSSPDKEPEAVEKVSSAKKPRASRKGAKGKTKAGGNEAAEEINNSNKSVNNSSLSEEGDSSAPTRKSGRGRKAKQTAKDTDGAIEESKEGKSSAEDGVFKQPTMSVGRRGRGSKTSESGDDQAADPAADPVPPENPPVKRGRGRRSQATPKPEAPVDEPKTSTGRSRRSAAASDTLERVAGQSDAHVKRGRSARASSGKELTTNEGVKTPAENVSNEENIADETIVRKSRGKRGKPVAEETTATKAGSRKGSSQSESDTVSEPTDTTSVTPAKRRRKTSEEKPVEQTETRKVRSAQKESDLTGHDVATTSITPAKRGRNTSLEENHEKPVTRKGRSAQRESESDSEETSFRTPAKRGRQSSLEVDVEKPGPRKGRSAQREGGSDFEETAFKTPAKRARAVRKQNTEETTPEKTEPSQRTGKRGKVPEVEKENHADVTPEENVTKTPAKRGRYAKSEPVKSQTDEGRSLEGQQVSKRTETSVKGATQTARSRRSQEAGSSTVTAEASDVGETGIGTRRGRKSVAAEKIELDTRAKGRGKRKAAANETERPTELSSPESVDDFKTPNKKNRRSTVKGKQLATADVSKRRNPSGVGSPLRSESEDVIGSPTTRRKSVDPKVLKPKVAFTGVVDEHGQKISKELGAELVSSVYECTHLVTDKVRRTVKFLCCVARGLPIVVPQWLDGCKDAGVFVDPTPFLVKDKGSEKQYKFCLQRSLEQASSERLLTGYSIHVTKSVRPDPPQMKDIIQCAGAEYLDSMPTKADDSGRVVVVSCEDDRKLCEAALSAGVPVVSSEFILTGILRQEILTDSFRLFEDKKTASKRLSVQPGSAKKRRK